MNYHQYNHIADDQLLDSFYANRNNEWLGILMQRYTLLLFGVCMKYLKNEEEARDAVQQVFLKTIAELHKYKVDYFKSWIYMVAKNYCLMKLRDKPGKFSTELNEQSLLIQDDPVSEQRHIEKDQLIETMTVALQELNSDQKQCVTLFYLEKQSYQQIADSTGYSLMQVKSHIQNGKRNLKLLIERRRHQS